MRASTPLPNTLSTLALGLLLSSLLKMSVLEMPGWAEKQSMLLPAERSRRCSSPHSIISSSCITTIHISMNQYHHNQPKLLGRPFIASPESQCTCVACTTVAQTLIINVLQGQQGKTRWLPDVACLGVGITHVVTPLGLHCPTGQQQELCQDMNAASSSCVPYILDNTLDLLSAIFDSVIM